MLAQFMNYINEFITNPALVAFLACFSPTVAFAAANKRHFFPWQIRNTLLLSFCLAFSAALLVWAFPSPPELSCVLAAAMFIVLSEYTISNLCPKKWRNYKAFATVLCISSALVYFFSPLVLSVPLSVYFVSSCLDMRKRQSGVSELNGFAAYLNARVTAESHGDVQQAVPFKHKPNIYILFLESFHSKEILKSIYGTDDDGVDDYLKNNNFSVYYNVFSNECWTRQSLFSILHMRHYTSATYLHPQEYPLALRTLRGNGYEVFGYDSDYLTLIPFMPYMECPGVDVEAFMRTPEYKALPFFCQSKWVRRKKRILHYDKVKTWPEMLDSLHNSISGAHDRPRCHIMHFGAAHTPPGYIYKNGSTWWVEHYRRVYKRAASQLREAVGLITANDPKALIVAVGDHGACRYRNSWRGGGDVNSVIRENGLEPALVGADASSVLLAVRWPVKEPAWNAPISHVNLFRFIFSGLVGEETANSRPWGAAEPDITVLEAGNDWIVARDGRALKDWERVYSSGSASNCQDLSVLSGGRALVWGTGGRYREVFAPRLRDIDVRIVGFLDNNPAVQGELMDGKKVFSPLELRDGNMPEYDWIIVASQASRHIFPQIRDAARPGTLVYMNEPPKGIVRVIQG